MGPEQVSPTSPSSWPIPLGPSLSALSTTGCHSSCGFLHCSHAANSHVLPWPWASRTLGLSDSLADHLHLTPSCDEGGMSQQISHVHRQSYVYWHLSHAVVKPETPVRLEPTCSSRIDPQVFPAPLCKHSPALTASPMSTLCPQPPAPLTWAGVGQLHLPPYPFSLPTLRLPASYFQTVNERPTSLL